MKDFIKIALGFVGGFALCSYGIRVASENGETVYEDDDKTVKSCYDKTGGWSYAKVDWKNINK